MTDERLLALARDGSEEAFRELYERYRLPLFRFGYRLTLSADASEDMVQECFLGLIRAPARFHPEHASLKTYLYAAIRNLTRKRVRDNGRELPDNPEPEPADALTILIHEETERQVRDAVASLPMSYREVIVMSEYDELSPAEIAQATGCDPGTVRVRLHRARAALRRMLTGKEQVWTN